jgi:nickel/cobalt transporter (NicO) family protein
MSMMFARMSVWSRPRVHALAAAALAILLVAVLSDAALAQGPFGVGPARSAPPEAVGGLIGWIMRQQAQYYREFTGLIRAARQGGGVAYALLGLSFTYGVFHAVGPGHGKAVISSYLFASGETWRRGVILSFASALMQSLVAVAVVGLFAVALGGTAKMMGSAVRNVEIASYLLVIAVGLRLAWIKGGGFLAQWRALPSRSMLPMPVAALATPGGAVVARAHHDHGPDQAYHHVYYGRGAHDPVKHHDQAREHDHDCAHDHADHSACGHSHGPPPQDLSGADGWRRGLSAIFAAGLRPCSGAIIVLVFCLSQGLFWTGVASTFAMGFGTAITVAALASLAVGARSVAARLAGTRQGFGLLVLRAVELCAALGIILVGVLLLTGYMASEQMFLV